MDDPSFWRFWRRPPGAVPVPLTTREVEYLIPRSPSSVVVLKEVYQDHRDPTRFAWGGSAVARVACGFANTSMSGVLLFGVKRRTRELTGVPAEHVEDLVAAITQALKTMAQPPIKHACGRHQVTRPDGEQVWVVSVDIPPARQLTKAGQPLAVYHHMGDETLRLQGSALEDLRWSWRRDCRMLSDDVVPVDSAPMAMFLDTTKLERVGLERMAQFDDKALQEELCRRGLSAKLPEGQVVMSVAGLLLLSKVDNWQEAADCPDYCIQIEVFDNDDPCGTAQSTVETGSCSCSVVYGDAVDQVDRAVEQIMRLANEQYQKRVAPAADGQTPAAGVKSSGEYTVYPLRAVRELIVNAVVHRTYCLNSGRIVIKIRPRSLELVVPGDPIDGLTAATIQSGEHVAASMRRNPIFAEYLSRMHRLRGGTSDMFPGVGTGVHFVVRRAIVAAGGTLTYRSEPGAVIVTVTAPP